MIGEMIGKEQGKITARHVQDSGGEPQGGSEHADQRPNLGVGLVCQPSSILRTKPAVQ
jgi:hypothetical protein